MSHPTTPGYAGDLTVHEAVERVAAGAVLVDVRTEDEWQQVGVPDTSAIGHPTVFLEWNRSAGRRNEDFLERLREFQGSDILLICRSGVRSVAAAESAAVAGHTVFNVLHGFEAAGGWRSARLPESSYPVPVSDGDGITG